MMNTNNINNASNARTRLIPPRFRESHFQRFAQYIVASLRAWPTPVQASPGQLTPETFARCVREAIQAKLRYGWQHPDLDEQLWATNGGNISVAIEEGIVLIGDITAINEARKAMLAKAANFDKPDAPNETCIFLSSDPNMIQRLCGLIAEGCFPGGTSFLLSTMLSHTQVEEYETMFDVSFVQTERGWRLS